MFLPTILMVAIGASATLFYGLALFIPLINLLQGSRDGADGESNWVAFEKRGRK